MKHCFFLLVFYVFLAFSIDAKALNVQNLSDWPENTSGRSSLAEILNEPAYDKGKANVLIDQQQKETVTGKVVDVNGESIIGAYVIEHGEPNNGTITNVDGEFSLSVKKNATLEVSYIGYVTQQVHLGKVTHSVPGERIVVTLIENLEILDEVVVVGYGSMERRTVTSSISSIKGDELNIGVGGSTIATALQGKIAGLVINGSSSPNSTNAFQLRGVASINASQGPLIVIDGIPGGDFRALNQEDIASIDVLRDASAGAIYGTRAAGGVILITTKQAKSGKAKITYSGEVSTETVRKRPDMLSGSEYLKYGVGEDFGSDTDWYGELVNNNPISQRHALTMSGGTKDVLLYASFNMQDQHGIVIGDNRKDFSGRLNGTFNLFDGKAQIITRSQYREAERDQRNSSESFNMAMTLSPTIPLMDPDNPLDYNVFGNGIYGTDFNPVADIMYQTNTGKDSWLLHNMSLKLSLIDNLTVQGSVSYQKMQWQYHRYKNDKHRWSVDNTKSGEAAQGFSKTEHYSADAYATYDKQLTEDHHLNAVAGYSFWEAGGESFSMTNANFAVDGIGAWDIGAGSYLSEGKASMSSNKSDRERLLSMFARVNYSYKDRYMLTASIRHEGSSKFGPNNRWGDFWAVSAGWRLSDEDFMRDVDWINELKIRGGYGITGNNGFGNGYTTRRYSSNNYWLVNGEWIMTYGPDRNVNADLKWEEKAELNVGFDYSLFDNRLYGKFDWYHRKVSDMLYTVNAPQPPMVFNTIIKNIGNLENKGWEFEIGGDVVRGKDLNYSTTMRFSHNMSKLLNIGLGDGEYIDQVTFPSPGNPGTGARLQNNKVIGQFFTFKHAGIDENGNWLIYDKDNNVVSVTDETLVEDNKHFVGNAIPKLIVAWDHNFQYKNFDLGISMRSWIDFDIFSQVNMYYGLKSQSQINILKDAYNKNKDINAEKILSDFWIEDGTFLKIDALTLGYRLKLKKYNNYIDNIRFYFTAKDLAVFTKYTGSNPEVDITGINPGFEYIKDKSSMYPQTTRLTLGAQITF